MNFTYYHFIKTCFLCSHQPLKLQVMQKPSLESTSCFDKATVLTIKKYILYLNLFLFNLQLKEPALLSQAR